MRDEVLFWVTVGMFLTLIVYMFYGLFAVIL